jgi:hypothetical protein
MGDCRNRLPRPYLRSPTLKEPKELAFLIMCISSNLI